MSFILKLIKFLIRGPGLIGSNNKKWRLLIENLNQVSKIEDPVGRGVTEACTRHTYPSDACHEAQKRSIGSPFPVAATLRPSAPTATSIAHEDAPPIGIAGPACAPTVRSQALTVASHPPLCTWRPLGDVATLRTAPVWPTRLYLGCQEDPNCCQISTKFPLPAATTEPSDESETAAGAAPEDWSVASSGGGEGGLGRGDPEIS